jgi:hypothetical protein
MNDPVQHKRNWKCSTVAQKVHNVHTSLTTESAHITIRPIRLAWQPWHWYSTLCTVEMQQFIGTVGKYIYVPKNAKFTQEKQNGNRLRREITPIKHGTLCLPEILEVEHFRMRSLRTHKSFPMISTSCRRCHLPVCLSVCLSHCTADARQDSQQL